jgi:hypothetical protein
MHNFKETGWGHDLKSYGSAWGLVKLLYTQQWTFGLIKSGEVLDYLSEGLSQKNKVMSPTRSWTKNHRAGESSSNLPDQSTDYLSDH